MEREQCSRCSTHPIDTSGNTNDLPIHCCDTGRSSYFSLRPMLRDAITPQFKFIISESMTTSMGHPWANHLNIRRDFKITCNFEQCDQDPAPHKFNDRNLIRSPDDNRVLTIRETITLHDVIALRDETTRLIKAKKGNCDILSITSQLNNLSIDTDKFRVIYR